QPIQLPPKTTSFQNWAQQLTNYAQSEVLKSELSYWLRESYTSVSPIPVDYPQGENTIASAQNISVSLNEVETRSLLQDVPKAYSTQINDVLLTALVLVLSRWTNSNSVLFNLEGHGREDIIEEVDLSRTVGWFTSIFPVVVELEESENLGRVLKSVKEQLRKIPNKGIGYGILRYLSSRDIQSQIKNLKEAEISFNYLGQFSQLFDRSSLLQLANESSGNYSSWQNVRSHLLDINAIITEERLHIDWIYSSNVHNSSTVEQIAQEFIALLRELISHCLSPENGGYTPSDFPLAKLSQIELDRVLATWAKEAGQQTTNWQNIEDIYPLSPMQQGMLFESFYAPETGVYFQQITFSITGNLNVSAFEQAWQQIVAQHSIFRTAFLWESLHQPLQVVWRQVNINVATYDWRNLSANEQQQQLEIFLESDRQLGFSFLPAPLMRLYLIQTQENTYQFVWSFHHILLDGWSLPLVLKDLWDFYEVILTGKSLERQPSLNYRQYIAWLQQQDVAQSEAFWREKLASFSAPTPLMIDKPLSHRENGLASYGEQHIELSLSATTKANSFVREHQLTLSNLVQATWALLLSRYSQESDVVFGASVSGRPPVINGVESMVGLFINTLPMRVRFNENTKLLGLLKDLQAQLVESEQFAYSSLVEIQGFSDVPRGTSLFDTIVVFENYPIDSDLLEDNSNFSFSNFRAIEQTNYPLTVVVGLGEQLFLKASYDKNRFDDGSISRMLGHFVNLLQAIVANPETTPISHLPMLTPSEQQQLLVEWNDTQTDYSVDQSLHQLFEEQVEKTPNAIAIVLENQQLTYRELNDRSNQLAHYLRSFGVGADVLVGICVERSLEMIVGILGILKAGGAYVPLDPDYPTERLRFMLSDSQVSVLLTQQKFVKTLYTTSLPQHQAQIVCLDRDWETIAEHSNANPEKTATSDNLAYIIYTSGSTGQPKGVLVNHSNVVRLFAATNDRYHFNEQDVWTLFHSYAFDFSVWEIWGALLYGGKLVVVPYLVTREPESFYKLLVEEKVTVLNQTPSAFRQLIQAEESLATVGDLKLRLVIFGGEALEPKSLQPWFERHGDRQPQLVNMYGITETTVHVTYRPLTIADVNGTASVIGRPIPDLQVYVLDQHLQPVPIGVPGEMYVGGAGVTRGYLNRPDLTSEKFIANPFDNSKNEAVETLYTTSLPPLLYKTGDLARYLPSGELEYLGRIDNQVKIRGFRIELGEIESLLVKHPTVWESVVVVREETPGDKRLVAYVVPKGEASIQSEELRQFVANQLPAYMVPNTFVVLESLPLTSNGKVDRRALPTPNVKSEPSDKYVAPRTPVEEMLAQIWIELLKVERVGIHDNFFELGGHSLLATQLVLCIRDRFKVELPLRDLFNAATLAELAQTIANLPQQNSDQTTPRILPRKRQ
ncbi:amino acid adenylation domain-containing protein, partial [Floridanema evergladense]